VRSNLPMLRPSPGAARANLFPRPPIHGCAPCISMQATQKEGFSIRETGPGEIKLHGLGPLLGRLAVGKVGLKPLIIWIPSVPDYTFVKFPQHKYLCY
jgi:hypothetical protein